MAATELGGVADSLARQFVNALEETINGNALVEAEKKSREGVKGWGCRNVTHFLRSLASSPPLLHDAHGSTPATINLHTLILYNQAEDPYSPLYGVERWGGDGLLLCWEELLKEEEEEEGSLERCMHAIGSLCRISLRELQLMCLPISPKHLNSLFQAMHQLLPISYNSPSTSCTHIEADQLSSSAHLNIHNDTAAITAPTNNYPGYTLQCLRLWGLYNPPGEGIGELQAVLTLPPSLLFLEFYDDSELYQPPIQLAPPVVADQVNANNKPAPAAAKGVGLQEGSEVAKSSSNYSLSSLLRCPHLCNLQGLNIFSNKIHNAGFIRSDEDLRNAALSLADNKSLKAFGIWIKSMPLLPEEFATQVLKLNTTLTTLHLWDFRMAQPSGFDLFFEEGVANNQTLTRLSLQSCEGPWTLESILDSLQDNGSLHDIDLYGTPLHDNPALEAQVERNKRSVEIMASLGVNPRKVQPSVARVFLCGEPYAGKTTIVKSLKRCTQKKLWNKDWLLYNQLGKERPRTKGIEVTTLERDGVKISFWDMAGQNEYRCFHDYVFPDLSNRQSPSCFLFVWSPICPQTQQEKTGEIFCKELEYWLRFITSKTRRTKKFIPNLIIAITRKDRVSNVKVSLQHEITLRQKKFESFITFGMSSVFEVDSRDPSTLDQLVQYIFQISRDILKSVKPVLELHEKIRMLFERKLRTREISPIITKEEYIEICEQELGKGSHDIAESVALLLNESGDFIYTGSHKFVIVDTKWFCHAIMGNLIHSTGPSSVVLGEKGRGFFEKGFLESFLEEENLKSNGGMKRFFHCCPKRNTKAKLPKVSGDTLLELLMELNVVCKDPDTSKIFLPSNLSSQEDTSSSNVKIISSQVTKGFQLGRRLQCEDSEHTFLTPGVFPGLQVTFFNKFGQRVKLEKDYIDVNHQSGVHVVIEFCAREGHDHSIDILVDSPRSLTYNVEWIKRNVVTDIVKLCASKKGIQGVQLVQSIIGPCNAIHLKTKRRQSVLVKDLQNQLEQDFISNSDVSEAFYAWPCDETTLLAKDEISKLLSAMEVQEVCECYGRKLKEAVSLMTRDLNPFLEKKIDEKIDLTYMSHNIEGGLEKILKEILEKLNEMKDEFHSDMNLIYKELVSINKGLSNLRHEVCERLLAMQELIRQSEERKLPTMWLLSVHRGKVITQVLQATGLHKAHLQLLCEHRSQPHLPKEQIGLAFPYLEDESFLQKALPYMQIFLKVAYIATKVGVHLISGGGGSLIPDFSQVTSLIEDWSFSMPSLPELERSSNLPQDDASSSIQQFRTKYQERARVWLWEFLEKKNCDKDNQIKNLFKLRPVRYKADNKIGWLCETHSLEGQELGELDLICLN